MAINPVTNLIYVINPAGNNLSVIDGSTNEIISTVNVSGSVSGLLQPVEGIGVNSITNQIYVANFILDTNTFNHIGVISVIDGLNNEVIDTVNVGSLFNGLFGEVLGRVVVNLTTNHIFVVEEGITDVPALNCSETIPGGKLRGNIKVIDGLTNQLIATDDLGFDMGSVEEIGIDVNPNTNLVYVTNGLTGNILVIMDEEESDILPPIPLPNYHQFNRQSYIGWRLSEAERGYCYCP